MNCLMLLEMLVVCIIECGDGVFSEESGGVCTVYLNCSFVGGTEHCDPRRKLSFKDNA